jgi:hypothetical protein
MGGAEGVEPPTSAGGRAALRDPRCSVPFELRPGTCFSPKGTIAATMIPLGVASRWLSYRAATGSRGSASSKESALPKQDFRNALQSEPAKPTTPEEEGIEVHPNAWERFERTVDKVVNSPPVH